METMSSKEQGDLVGGDVKNILVNFTPTRDWVGVAEHAIRHARRLGARLYFIEVIHDPFGYSGWNLPMPSLEKEYESIVEEARDRLRAIVQAEKDKGVVIESIVREGDPVAQITEVIKEKGIDLLVVPAHQEDRIESFLFGSVNQKLIREMPCSIMLLKAAPGDM
ncbi:MAG TPA: universal stress protein [Syntrophorhabdales bacterium]|nr:universal stress protein [Syntrophorhabdales bacterium]